MKKKDEIRSLGQHRAAKLAEMTKQGVLRRTAALLAKYLPPATHLVMSVSFKTIDCVLRLN